MNNDKFNTKRLRLYVWEDKSGGLCRSWRNLGSLNWSAGNFFTFGRFGGGYMPFKRLNEKTKAETILAAQRAGELYNCFVDVFFEKP